MSKNCRIVQKLAKYKQKCRKTEKTPTKISKTEKKF